MASGLDKIPLRIPKEWDPAWFSTFIQEVLRYADIRNAIEGPGIAIEGESDVPATISANADLLDLLNQSYILATSSSFLTNERILEAEGGILEAVDTGPNGTFTIRVKQNGINASKFRQSGPLTVVGRPTNTAGNISDIAASADEQLLMRSGTTLKFAGNPRNMIGATWVIGAGAITTPVNDVALYISKACRIVSVSVVTDGGPGDCVIDIWKDVIANYPPTVLDTITAAAKPTISSGLTYVDTTLTGWDKDLDAGDVVMFHLDSVVAFSSIAIQLHLREPT